jgi:hypothetical protein
MGTANLARRAGVGRAAEVRRVGMRREMRTLVTTARLGQGLPFVRPRMVVRPLRQQDGRKIAEREPDPVAT